MQLLGNAASQRKHSPILAFPLCIALTQSPRHTDTNKWTFFYSIFPFSIHFKFDIEYGLHVSFWHFRTICFFYNLGTTGRGVRAGGKKTQRVYKKVFFFFQKPYKIILGPPKHVLHLVCIVLGISTAIKTALKVTDRLFKWSINGKRKPV